MSGKPSSFMSRICTDNPKSIGAAETGLPSSSRKYSAHFTAVNWAEFFRDEDGNPVSAAPMDFGLSVQIRDINEDGFPDIYVCNDFQTPDRVWLNDGRGHFRAMPRLALRNMSYASMGVDFADIDRDGRLDFITVDMLSREHSTRMRQLS